MEAYIKEIAKYKLLTKDEEFELFVKFNNIKEQFYYEKYESLSELLNEYMCLRDRLVNCNLRLVVNVAKHYRAKIDIQDLISAGNIGLITAVERFDPRRNNLTIRFYTYACYYIKMEIRLAKRQQVETIRLPNHVVDKISKYKKTGIHNNKLDLINKAAIKKSKEDVSALNIPTPYKELADQYVLILDDLTEREKYVIKERLDQKTLKHLGSKLKVSREYVRIIEKNAIEKIRVRYL